MSAEKVAAIRKDNNSTTVSRLFLDENNESASNSTDIPNPIESFEQCFSKYPDLMGKLTHTHTHSH